MGPEDVRHFWCRAFVGLATVHHGEATDGGKDGRRVDVIAVYVLEPASSTQPIVYTDALHVSALSPSQRFLVLSDKGMATPWLGVQEATKVKTFGVEFLTSHYGHQNGRTKSVGVWNNKSLPSCTLEQVQRNLRGGKDVP